jgi:hypothetical protein
MITLGRGCWPSRGPALPPTTTDTKAQAQSQTSDIGWEWTRLDMTRSHGRPCLGPTSPTALGTMGRGATTGRRRPRVALAVNRATTWSHLHRHQHRDMETSPSSCTRLACYAYKRRRAAWFRGSLPLGFSFSSFLLSFLSHTPGPSLGL